MRLDSPLVYTKNDSKLATRFDQSFIGELIPFFEHMTLSVVHKLYGAVTVLSHTKFKITH